MRNLIKAAAPEVLSDNEETWLEEYLADKTNATKKYRYRHRDIKNALLNETSHKCIYCESKLGHNTPGDVEHKTPSSVVPESHFAWDNLTISCTECNRRKSNYFSEEEPFLDPYSMDVEAELIHYGPVVGWRPGHREAEISIKLLELHNHARRELISRKIEKIEEVNLILSRIAECGSDVLRQVLIRQLDEMKLPSAEYSGMVGSICGQAQG